MDCLSEELPGPSSSRIQWGALEIPGSPDSASSTLSKKFKRLYRVITDLETKVKQQEAAADMEEGNSSRVLLTGKEVVNADVDKEKWQRRVADHKECVPLLSIYE